MAQWIWKFGEYEIYHSMLLHNRRDHYGDREASIWKIYPPENLVRFIRPLAGETGEIHIDACGYWNAIVIDANGEEQKYHGAKAVTLKPGDREVRITVSNTETLPCLFVDGVVFTNEDWLADDLACEPTAVGTNQSFDTPERRPDVFPFAYEPMAYTNRESVNGGTLFDFGRETFCKTSFALPDDSEVFISFGESREEALDPEWSVLHSTEKVVDGGVTLSPRAFRYIFVRSKNVDVTAQYEYLPLEYKGSFEADEEVVNQVWGLAAYTFHLNSREFFLDGIKRDRWVWSGDAYQSLFVNRYLFFDADIEQRTLTALGGKRPFEGHLNTIVDYTFLWVMGLWEHYVTYGDKKYLRQIFPQLQEVMLFCRGRIDPDGFVRGKRGDWIFIDWAPMDKEGALCGEQVLFAKALEDYSKICAALGRDDGGCLTQAKALQAATLDAFLDVEKGVFVDSFESGKRNVTRHSNILAYLFLPLDEKVKASLYKNVLLNDAVRQITTPYFKFFENQVHCEAGNLKLLEESIRVYYGSMLATGATSLYEEFDPTKTGVEHYAMYGGRYEKSLCHAWSCSPIYLLARYRLGVKNTGIAYDSFVVEPQRGDLNEFSGVVPIPGGQVKVCVKESEMSATATRSGGTLIVEGESYVLTPGETKTVKTSAPTA